MEQKLKNTAETLRVLLIGNDPIDLGKTLETVKQIRGKKIVTEIAFDLRSIVDRLINFHPNFILIDDNIGKTELTQTMTMLNHNRRTKKIPVTIIKNSNYEESSPSSRILDFVLKQNFSAESLYTTIVNTLKFERTQRFLSRLYRKRKGQHGLAF